MNLKYSKFELVGLAWMACQGHDTPWKVEDFDLMSKQELINIINNYNPELLKDKEVEYV